MTLREIAIKELEAKIKEKEEQYKEASQQYRTTLNEGDKPALKAQIEQHKAERQEHEAELKRLKAGEALSLYTPRNLSLQLPSFSYILHYLERIIPRRLRFALAVTVLLVLASYWLIPYIYVIYGNTYFKYGDFTQATKYYENARKKMYSPLRRWMRMQAIALHRLLLAQGHQALEREAWDEAEAAFRELQQQHSSQWQSHGYAGLAAVAVARGDTQRARGLVHEAAAYDPANLFSDVVHGYIFFHEGNFEEAIRNYTIAESKAGSLPWQRVLASKGLLLAQGYQALMREAWSNAEAALHELRQPPTPRQWQSHGYAGLAAVAMARGDTQRARGLVHEAAAYDPANLFSDVVRGHIFLHQGEIEKANQAYRSAVDKPDGLPWQRAVALSHLGRLEAAEGYVKIALKTYDEALKYYTKAPSFSHKMAEVSANTAYLLEEQGWVAALQLSDKGWKFDKAPPLSASPFYEQALRINPNDHFTQTLVDGMHWRQQSVRERAAVERLLPASKTCRKPPSGSSAQSAPLLTLAMHTFERQGLFAPRAGEGDVLVHRIVELLQKSGSVTMRDSALEHACVVVCLLVEGRIARSPTDRVRKGELRITFRETATNHNRVNTKVEWTYGVLDGVAEALAHDILRQLHQAYPGGCSAS